MIGIYFGAGSGAEHPLDWNLDYPTKEVSMLGFSCRSIEKMKLLKKFLSMVFFMVLPISRKISH
jgi:hypothetical protein